MIATRLQLQLPTHQCSVCVQDSGTITVFKSTTTTCDMAVFASEDSWAASDYIVEPLPLVYWGVTFPEDPPYQPY